MMQVMSKQTKLNGNAWLPFIVCKITKAHAESKACRQYRRPVLPGYYHTLTPTSNVCCCTGELVRQTALLYQPRFKTADKDLEQVRVNKQHHAAATVEVKSPVCERTCGVLG